MLILGWEDAIHGVGPLDDDRPDLLSVHRLCSGNSAVAYQSGDLLYGTPASDSSETQATPQLARRPLMRIEPGGNHSAEGAPDRTTDGNLGGDGLLARECLPQQCPQLSGFRQEASFGDSRVRGVR